MAPGADPPPPPPYCFPLPTFIHFPSWDLCVSFGLRRTVDGSMTPKGFDVCHSAALTPQHPTYLFTGKSQTPSCAYDWPPTRQHELCVQCDSAAGLSAVLFTEWRRAYYWLLCCVTCKRPKDRDEAEETPVSIFANDADRREFICAGAAAGIAVGSSFPFLTASHAAGEDVECISPALRQGGQLLFEVRQNCRFQLTTSVSQTLAEPCCPVQP